MVVLHLRTVPSSAARCFASADFASLCVLEASAASRPPMRAVLPCSLGLLRAASPTGRALRAPPPLPPPQFAMVVPHLRTDPQFSMVVPLRSQARLRHSLLHWAYFGLFRALRAAFVRPTGCAVSFALIGLTPRCFAHSACSSCAPLVNPSVAATPRHLPLHKGGSGVVLLTAIVPLTKRLPLIPRGAVGASRLRGFPSDQSIIRSSTSISSTSGLRSALPRAS